MNVLNRWKGIERGRYWKSRITYRIIEINLILTKWIVVSSEIENWIYRLWIVSAIETWWWIICLLNLRNSLKTLYSSVEAIYKRWSVLMSSSRLSRLMVIIIITLLLTTILDFISKPIHMIIEVFRKTDSCISRNQRSNMNQ